MSPLNPTLNRRLAERLAAACAARGVNLRDLFDATVTVTAGLPPESALTVTATVEQHKEVLEQIALRFVFPTGETLIVPAPEVGEFLFERFARKLLADLPLPPALEQN